MEADIICSVLVMRYLSGRNTCFLSLANVYLAVCGLTRTLQPAFSPVRFRLLSMFHTSPTGNRDSSKNMIERTAVALFFCLFHFFMIPLYQSQCVAIWNIMATGNSTLPKTWNIAKLCQISWLFPRPVTCGLNQDITDTMNKSIKIQLITKVLFIRFQFYYIAKGTTFILKAFIPLCHYEIGAGCPCIDRTVRSRNGGA